MTLRPVDDRVVLEPKDLGAKQVGGIYIPDSAKEKPQIAEVIAVGTDEELKELVKVGDKVLYAKYGGTEVEIENKKLIIISRSDILAIVD